jgi:CDP-diacylglycerol pyrophosphatase
MKKLHKAVDMFFMKEGVIYMRNESKEKPCTQLKMRKGSECYEEFMDHMEYFIKPVFRKSGASSSAYKSLVKE